MKILQVASSLPGKGGIEKSVLHLAAGLRERGHEVDIAAIPESWVWEQARMLGINTVPLTVRKKRDFAALRPFVEFLRGHRYDIINTHFALDYIIPALAARRSQHPNLVMTRYQVKTWRGPKRWLYERGLGYRKIIAVSHAARKALLKGGMAEGFVEVVHGGVATPQAQPIDLRAEFNLPPERPLIGIVSRITLEKGHLYLMQALREVKTNAVCLVVGEGPDRAKIETFVQANALQDRVRFLGWRTDSDAIMAALDVVVQPSLWEEACSLSIMEAMASGKPVVATDSGGNSELVLHGQTGMIVPKTNPAELAAALDRLATDRDLRREYGAAARCHQQEEFSIQTMAEGTERVYARLLAEAGGMRKKG